jgi:hypothetical protein
MALPKKRDISLKPPKNMWNEQFIQKNKSFLPRNVDLGDIDNGFFDFIKNDLSKSIGYIDKPIHFIGLTRWSEFTKQWPNTDKYNNLKIPFLSINRENAPEVGTNPVDYKIPIRKNFPYMKIPVWDGNRKGVDIYTIPNPVGVDMLYSVKFFSFKMSELNDVYKKISELFASAQIYTNVKGHYFPILLESIDDESEFTDLDNKRYYVQSYEMKLQGYIVDSEEFEVKPALSRVFVTTEISRKIPKPIIKKVFGNDKKETTIGITISFLPGSVSSLQFGSEDEIFVNSISVDNISHYTIKINNVNVTTPFKINRDDIIYINIIKEDANSNSDITLNGKTTN